MTDPPTTGRRRPGSAGADPLGKRALFTAAPVTPVGADPFAPASARGRRALFSDVPTTGPADAGRPPTGSGSAFVLVCRSCEARTELGLLALATRLVPSLWLPGRRWSRYVRCPACRRPAWCRLERST